MFKRKLLSLLFLALLAPLAPSIFAEENDVSEISSSNVIVIADVNLRELEIVSQENNQFQISFEVHNSMEIQSNLIYGIELVKRDEKNGDILLDSIAFPEDRITVSKDFPVKKEIEYTAPEFFSGECELWVLIKDESGLILSLGNKKVTLPGTGTYLQLSDPCYLTIEGEVDKKYGLSQGVDVKPEEKVFLECQAENKSGESITANPKFEIYERNSFSSKKSVTDVSENSTVFTPGEKKLIKVPLILPSTPRAYDIKTQLMKLNGGGYQIFSNPIFAHLVIVGRSATINSASLDKDYYQKGDVAKISYLISGAADFFVGSRYGGSSFSKPVFGVEFKDGKGEFCANKGDFPVAVFNDKKTIEIKIIKDCLDPQVFLGIFDDQIQLAEKNLTVKSQSFSQENNQKQDLEKKKEALSLSIYLILGLILIVLIISLIFIKKRRGGNEYEKMLFFFLFFFALSFLMKENVSAHSIILENPNPWLLTGQQVITYKANTVDILECSSLNSGISTAPWAICNVQTGNCNVTSFPAKVSYTNGEGVNYKFYCPSALDLNTCVACYKDKVGFTFALDKSSYVQNESISASATVATINSCSNGVASSAYVDNKTQDGFNSKAFTIFYNKNVSVNNPSQYGATSFSAGATPGSFTARFTGIANHSTSTDLSGAFSGTYDIGYTVTAPVCTPDCSCAANTCIGSTCSNGCGGACAGTKNCSTPICVSTGCPASCSNTCSGQSCGADNCGNACYGSKDCNAPRCQQACPEFQNYNNFSCVTANSISGYTNYSEFYCAPDGGGNPQYCSGCAPGNIPSRGLCVPMSAYSNYDGIYINAFYADRASLNIEYGMGARLYWKIGAQREGMPSYVFPDDTCRIQEGHGYTTLVSFGGISLRDGNFYADNLTRDTTFILRCTYRGNTVSRSIDVCVGNPPSYSCTNSIPSGSIMCSGDDTNPPSNLAWQYTGTTQSSCTGRKCEYYTPCIPGCSKNLNDCGENCGTIGKYICISNCSNECDSDSDCKETTNCSCNSGEWIEASD